jgi:hypothetical protein
MATHVVEATDTRSNRRKEEKLEARAKSMKSINSIDCVSVFYNRS